MKWISAAHKNSTVNINFSKSIVMKRCYDKLRIRAFILLDICWRWEWWRYWCVCVCVCASMFRVWIAAAATNVLFKNIQENKSHIKNLYEIRNEKNEICVNTIFLLFAMWKCVASALFLSPAISVLNCWTISMRFISFYFFVILIFISHLLLGLSFLFFPFSSSYFFLRFGTFHSNRKVE